MLPRLGATWRAVCAALLAALAWFGSTARAENGLVEGPKLGLFIGINTYPRMEGKNLQGAVRDAAAMHALFRDRFGFGEARLLTDGEATRAGIESALRALMERAERTTGEGAAPAQVVIFFAGHGSRARDQAAVSEGKDEEDGYDETWVPSDGSFEGEADIRDDDIQVVIESLVKMGCEVVFISDSCHSGTVHRGGETLRSRMIDRSEDVDGPKSPMFARGSDREERGGGVGSLDFVPGGSFVSFTACRDHQKAWEGVDESGQAVGRFSMAFRSTVAGVSGATTVEALHQGIERAIATMWPDGMQASMLAASAGMRSALFLGRASGPAHARVVSGTIRDGQCTITMGDLHGVSVAAEAMFFASVEAMLADAVPMGRGRVTAVEPLSASVAVEDGVVAEGSAVRVEAVRCATVRIYVPDELAIDVAGAEAGWQRVSSRDDAALVVERMDDGAYCVLAAGDASRGSSAQPLHCVKGDDMGWALTRAAGAYRLLSLAHREGLIGVRVLREGADTEGETSADVLRAGERFTIKVSNRSATALHVVLMSVSLSEGVEVVAPLPGEAELIVPAQGSVVVGEGRPFEAVLDGSRGDGESERTFLKVIARSEALDGQALAEAAWPRAGRTRGGTLGDVLSLVRGDEPALSEHRGVRRRTQEGMVWAATTLVVEVVPDPKVGGGS